MLPLMAGGVNQTGVPLCDAGVGLSIWAKKKALGAFGKVGGSLRRVIGVECGLDHLLDLCCGE